MRHGSRLDDLLDFNEPLIRATAPNPPKQAPATSAAPVPAESAAATEAADEDNDELSIEDWVAALAQIQQEVQDAQQRAILEEALRLRAEQQEQEKRDAILKALFLREVVQRYARSLGDD